MDFGSKDVAHLLSCIVQGVDADLPFSKKSKLELI